MRLSMEDMKVHGSGKSKNCITAASHATNCSDNLSPLTTLDSGLLAQSSIMLRRSGQASLTFTALKIKDFVINHLSAPSPASVETSSITIMFLSLPQHSFLSNRCYLVNIPSRWRFIVSKRNFSDV